MPVYKLNTVGIAKPRLVRAETEAQARKHLTTCKAVTAEEMVDLMLEHEITVEKAEPKPEPEAPTPVITKVEPSKGEE